MSGSLLMQGGNLFKLYTNEVKAQVTENANFTLTGKNGATKILALREAAHLQRLGADKLCLVTLHERLRLQAPSQEDREQWLKALSKMTGHSKVETITDDESEHTNTEESKLCDLEVKASD